MPTESITTTPEEIVKVVREQGLSFVPWRRFNEEEGVNEEGVCIFQGGDVLCDVSVDVPSGKLVKNPTDRPEIEIVLEYIRQCLRTYRNAWAGVDEKGSKLYLLYEAEIDSQL